jgi:hypothetical protein
MILPRYRPIKSRFQQKPPKLKSECQQIVPRPFFSDLPCKNRGAAKFSALTDTSWRKFWGQKVDDPKNCQKNTQTFFFHKTSKSCPIIMKFILEAKNITSNKI